MDLSGEWFNELGSSMLVEVRGTTLTGKYHTAVGDADGVYELIGRVSVPDAATKTLGFVVAWQNDKRKVDSATAWCGEARELDGTQSITTTWLLTAETAPTDDWKSTLVGKDCFLRTPPSAAQMKKNRALRRPSHHAKA
jgi:hypothetical protein